MGTWLIKLVFKRGKKQRYACLSFISRVAHVIALMNLTLTGALAFLGCASGPRKDDPCGSWVFGSAEAMDLLYLFVNWFFSVTVVDYSIFMVRHPASSDLIHPVFSFLCGWRDLKTARSPISSLQHSLSLASDLGVAALRSCPSSIACSVPRGLETCWPPTSLSAERLNLNVLIVSLWA